MRPPSAHKVCPVMYPAACPATASAPPRPHIPAQLCAVSVLEQEEEWEGKKEKRGEQAPGGA